MENKSKATLTKLQERAIEKFEKDHRLEDGRLADIGFNGGTTEDFINSLITEVWNEAELSGKVQALHAMEDIYHKANDKADLMEMTNEALLPKPNITSDK